MRKLILYILIHMSIVLWALPLDDSPSVYPDIWHRSDSLMLMPQEDSISWTDEYTVFSVVRSLNDSVAECLWSFAENDTISAAVLTKGIYTPTTGKLLSRNPHDFSRWCVYAYHSGIYADSTKQRTLRLGEQIVYVDSITTDTLPAQVEIEEIAYFRGNVPRLFSDAFQTYLALKYGVTLDYAPYISQLGDTLWHPEYDEEFYHRVVGVGSDTIRHWSSHISKSKEDSLFVIHTDTLMPNEYIIMGDDNGPLDWARDIDDEYYIQRAWRIKQMVSQPKTITLALRLSVIEEATDSLQLAVTDVVGTLLQTISPDSIMQDSMCYFTLNMTDSLLQFRIKDAISHETHSMIDDTANPQNGNVSETNISFDANSQTIVINGFSDGQVFELYLYDNLGRYFTTVTSLNPIDVRLLPNMISYIEILADNQIVGAINIPTTMH